MNIGTLAPLLERFDYDRANLLDQEIHDALVDLAAAKARSMMKRNGEIK